MYKRLETEFGEIIITRENADGSVSHIPAKESNKDYQEYLRYTAWVEAGNNPEEFWTQSEVN